MPQARPRLRALATRLGIEDGYVSALDRRYVATSDESREALASAMGWDASSEAAADAALARLDAPAPAEHAAPTRCTDFRERLAGRGVFGLWSNLYSVRSRRSWGFGNLGDLRELLAHAARAGAAFVGVNPLHALGNRESGMCPYAPVSRLFRNPLYLDVQRVPGLLETPEAAALSDRIEALRAARSLDLEALEATLFAALRPLHARSRAGAGASQGARTEARLREPRAGALRAFASYQAIADDFEPRTGARDWRRWPAELQRPDSPAVTVFAAQHAAEVDFHLWLQLLIESQLEGIAEQARVLGMALGVCADLALGSAADGFDVWAHRELFARGARVGAPPDPFAPEGQDWGFPPLDPQALRRDGFDFWRRVLEANLVGAGALRIDHALGLRRLFWIPEDARPSEGAYVRSPEPELLEVLARVSRSRNALVIGEDLGTVPEGFSREIQARGLLSSRVLVFERDDHGFHPSGAWPEACLATANTHDLVPLAGWLDDGDLALRRASGQIADTAGEAAIRRERRSDRSALRERLLAEGCLPPEAGFEDGLAWMVAVTRFLCRTPAALVGLSLDDLAGERIPINLPGVPPERHRSWARRMEHSLEDLFAQDRARRVLEAVRRERRGLG